MSTSEKTEREINFGSTESEIIRLMQTDEKTRGKNKPTGASTIIKEIMWKRNTVCIESCFGSSVTIGIAFHAV
jgi:hypothetical protein